MDVALATELRNVGADRVDLLTQRNRFAPPRGRASILVACMPKSGSTFLSQVISQVSGFPQRKFVYDINGHNGWDLYLPKLIHAATHEPSAAFVAQHHLLATPPNLELIKLFGLKTIVLVRNIFDVVISLRDHCLAVKNDPRIVSRMPLDVPQDIAEMDSETQFDWIIEFKIPWYFQFYVGWYKVLAARAIDCLLASYDLMMSNQLHSMHTLLRRLDIPCSLEDVRIAIGDSVCDPYAIRMNKGVTGRGVEELNEKQIARIGDLARYYPGVNFELIGLPSA